MEYFESGGDAGVVFAWYEPQHQNFNEATRLASGADVAIVCVGFKAQIEHEGAERLFELPADQDSIAGKFELLVGASSSDIRLRKTITVN